MKNLVRNLTVVSCMGSSLIAAPFLAIGDNAELFVTADVTAAYNDNILLSPSGAEIEDTILTFRPGFDLQFGKGSSVKGNVVGSSTLTSYSDESELNNQLLGIAANAAYDSGGPLTLSTNASFAELDQPISEAGPGLVERDVTSAGFSGEMQFSEKISLRLVM
jgi:hypothetical protein